MKSLGDPMLAVQIIDSGALYLIIGAALIFGACAYAAKRILRQLTLTQMGWSLLVTAVTLAVIWGFLALNTHKLEPTQNAPDLNQRTPLLQPAPD
jgi:hypothetical protein